jgi:hypothetical protein
VVASVRSLIEKIVIYPNNDPQSRDLELVGQLAALLSTRGPYGIPPLTHNEGKQHRKPGEFVRRLLVPKLPLEPKPRARIHP